jgi:hypothetical protein
MSDTAEPGNGRVSVARAREIANMLERSEVSLVPSSRVTDVQAHQVTFDLIDICRMYAAILVLREAAEKENKS